MKHKKRKLLAVVTAVFMALTVCMIPAESVSAESSTDVEWKDGITGGAIYFDKSTGTITSCDSGITSADIPEKIEDVKVTAIKESAFRDCDSLTRVTIPDSVATIGYMAFYSCDKLASVEIPKSVTDIGNEAFGCCNILTDIRVVEENENYSSQNGILYDENKTKLLQYPCAKEGQSFIVPNTVKTIGYSAFYRCSKLESISLPNNLNSIEDRAFCACYGLTGITIPNGVASIGKEAFSSCGSLTEAKIPNSVTSIDYSAFASCKSLTDVIIPASVTYIGTGAFHNCKSLTNIKVDENNKEYFSDKGVLYDKEQTVLMQYPAGNEMTSYAIPGNVKTIEKDAFNSCKYLTSVTIPNGLVSIGDYAFQSCKVLTDITIPDSVTSIGNGAFQNCVSLANITVGKNNKKYSSADGVLFDKEQTVLMLYPYGNNRRFYEIPDGVKTIDEMAFFYSDFLTSIVIPESVTSISNGAFSYSESLTLYGRKGSYAETFANMLGISFKALPSAPDKLAVNLNEKYDTLKASWNKAAGADGYYVYYKKSTWKNYQKLGTTTALSYSKAKLADGAKYKFAVYPYMNIGDQKYRTKNGKSSDYVYTLKKLNKPGVKKSSRSYVRVSWNNIPGETRYQIARSKSSTKNFKIVKRVSSKYKSTKIKTPRYKKYYYKVRAYKTVNGKRVYGPWSSGKSYRLI